MATRRRTTPRRRTTRRRTKKTPLVLSGRFLREGLALVLLFLAIISVIALFAPDAGAIVRPWHDLLSTLLGWGIAFAPPLLAGFALMLWMKTMPAERWMAASGAALVALALLGMFHLAVGGGPEAVETGQGGGALGFAVSGVISTAVGEAGAWIVLVLLAIVGLLLYFNMTIGDLIAGYLADRDERVAREAEAARRASGRRPRAVPEPPGVASTEMEARPGLIDRMRDRLAVAHDAEDEPPLIVRRERPATNGNGRPRPAAPAPEPDLDDAGDATGSPTSIEELEHEEVVHLAEAAAGEVADAALETVERAWELPPIDLLADAPESSAAQLDLSAKGRRIRETLAHFGIGVKVARIQEGPVVTQYALDVDPGIKLSRIEGLADNLALALSARSIRIEAPIPGEPYVGIEIPNAAFDLVTLKEVLASRNFAEMSERSKLAFALGQDVAGQPFSADLSKMPHMLIAGATGSGKSVCVNAIIDSFLMNATPAEVKLILIDPKRVELAQYKGIPHLLCEVIVEPDKAVNALKWTVGTMESRYAEFAARGVRNIAGYNEALRPGQPRMPYIVIVIDELADLMMVSAYEVESTITRIAQLARATGIHLVVATQRPSVQVITGLIKANIPSRIAFAMTSGIDSRTILDTTGAEDLLGRGDMLYQPIDAPRAVRLQGVLVTDPEIESVARHWRGQGGPQYRPEITAVKRGGKGGGTPGEDDEDDDADALLTQAVDIVRRSDKASASLLQRRLRIGYARAARILDQMEDRGIVGPADGSRFREVLVTSDGWGGDVAPDEDEGVTDQVHRLGEVLRAAREGKGVDLPRVERETKIRERYLSALERGEYRELPGAVYTKGFLRNYGAYLGLDPEYLIDLYRLETTATADRPSAPTPPRPLAGRRSRAFVVTPGAVVAGILTILVGGFIAYLGYEFVNFARTPELRITDPAGNVNRHPELAITIRGVTAPNARVSVSNLTENPTVTADADGTFEVTVRLVPGSNVAKLTARDPVTGRDSETEERTIVVATEPEPSASTAPVALEVIDPADGAEVGEQVGVGGSAGAGATLTVNAVLVEPSSPTFTISDPTGAEVDLDPADPTSPEPLTITADGTGAFAGGLTLAPGTWELTIVTDGSAPVVRTVVVTQPSGLRATLAVGEGGSYVELEEDGAAAEASGTIAADGDEILLEAEESLRIRVGNAGAVRATINGIPLGAMGAEGAVVEWRVQRTGG